MKICIVGDVEGNHDEGMKNVAYNIYNELKKDNIEILVLRPQNVFYLNFWSKIKKFNPEIIHYIAGPTIISFIILKVLKLLCEDSKTIMSMIHPRFLVSKHLISFLKPDLILIQSYETERLCKDIKCDYEFLPNGVDIKRFKPIDLESKKKIRAKYNISDNKFVVLHVGNLREGRNLSILKNINQKDIEVVIVCSTTISKHKNHYNDLKKSGIIIFDEFIPNIEEIYHLADCYVFPTFSNDNCIEMPLSVMEAMACNMPVVTTKFGALPLIFEEGDGLIFADNEEEIIREIKKIQVDNYAKIQIRDKIVDYTWVNVTEKLRKIYLRL